MRPDFATKLRLTAAVLGCPGRKELCARFRSVNPATHFDLERSHKWLQGRALPRSALVYDDWAKVLGTRRSGAWLASCTVDAFLAEICELYDADAATLRTRAEMDAARTGSAQWSHGGLPFGYLCGAYACYSMAWSPYYRGQIIRGALLLRLGSKAAPLAARYSEGLLGGTVFFDGDGLLAGRTLHLPLRSLDDGSPLFISLFLPGPPASVLCGVMSGATVVGPEPVPVATCFVAVRVPADAAATNRYMASIADSVSGDLAALGLPLSDPEPVGSLICALLLGESAGGLKGVSAASQAGLAAALDKIYLGVG